MHNAMYELRGSRIVLREAGGEVPLVYSPAAKRCCREILLLKTPPVGRNDTVCEVNLQTSKSRVTCNRLIVVLFKDRELCHK
ncbi:MAG: hypothetical protein L3J75_13385 [Methylococcaceae bacterium]|nr:hypothetical protein [Methylococcaceae bacterium]